jgi:NAD(P)-dependent dehydrogenase (short-subunit alcohol dehydrogenase family)
LLLRILRERGLLTAIICVIWVSSGGMYLQRLDLRDLTAARSYQRHTVYANAKRAQVMLARHLAERWSEPLSASMHPGWVDTDAVRHSMPVFRLLTAPILRTPDQGADTIVWLATTAERPATGRFWFDRTAVSEHRVDRTRASEDDLQSLVDHVFTATDPYL